MDKLNSLYKSSRCLGDKPKELLIYQCRFKDRRTTEAKTHTSESSAISFFFYASELPCRQGSLIFLTQKLVLQQMTMSQLM